MLDSTEGHSKDDINARIVLKLPLNKSFFLLAVVLLFVAVGSLRAEEQSFKGKLVTIEDSSEPVIGMNHQDVIASGCKSASNVWHRRGQGRSG